MKEISLLTNIVVYAALFIALFYNVTDKIKRNRIEHFLLFVSMIWTLFISAFLIKNFQAMVDAPLNLKLNVYETVTNFIFLLYICYNIYEGHCLKEEKPSKDKGSFLKTEEDDFGGGGIKNPTKP